MAVASLATVVITPLVEFWMAAGLGGVVAVVILDAGQLDERAAGAGAVLAGNHGNGLGGVKVPGSGFLGGGASSSAASLLSAGAASLLEAAVLSEAAVDSEVAVLPQAARLRAMAAAPNQSDLAFHVSSSPLRIHFVQVMPAAVP